MKQPTNLQWLALLLVLVGGYTLGRLSQPSVPPPGRFVHHTPAGSTWFDFTVLDTATGQYCLPDAVWKMNPDMWKNQKGAVPCEVR